MPREPDHLFLVADVLGVDATDGEVRLKLGDAVSEEGHVAEVPCYGPDGFLGVPDAPAANGDAAQACYYQDGDQFVCTGTRDNRIAAKAGSLKPGDRAIVTNGKPRILVKRDANMIALYTERDSDGKSMMLLLDGKRGELRIAIGGAQLVFSEQGFDVQTVGAGGAAGPAISLSGQKGYGLIRASTCHLDGGFCTVGLNTDGTRPILFGVENAIIGPSGMLGIPAPKVLLASH